MNNKLKFWILATLLCSSIWATAQNQAPLGKGDYVDNFIEIDSKGNSISLNDYKGKVVLLNFTATWCGPCWETYTPMNQLQERYKEDLVIISFHMDEMKDKWKKRAASKGITFDVISIWESDTKKEVFDSFAPKMFPSFVLLDDTGKIKKKWGGNSKKSITRNVHKAMRQNK